MIDIEDMAYQFMEGFYWTDDKWDHKNYDTPDNKNA